MNQNLAVTGMLPSSAAPAIALIASPLKPELVEHEFVEPGLSVASHLERYDLSTYPTLVMHNQTPLLEAEWDDVTLEKGDVLTLIREPGIITGTALVVFWVIVAITAVVAAYSLYMILTMDMGDPGERGDSPNYSVSYRGNQRRPGQPISVLFGLMRTFPDYTGSYTEFRDNEQWMYQIFDVTLGECDPFDETTIQYEDTPLANFDEYEWEQLNPGETSTIFPSVVHISDEVQDIELTDKDDWGIIYSANPVATTITAIHVDIVAPQGIYEVDDKGRYDHWSEPYTIQWREVGTTPWSEKSYRTGKSVIPLRKTHRIVVPEGRYEVRVKRNRDKWNKTYYANAVHWQGLRGFEPNRDVTETTRLAIAVQASSALGNAALSKLSVLAQRKLPIYNGTGWNAPAATSLACWAFADAVMADYGGNLDEKFVDLQDMLTLAATGIEFNGVFDNKNTLWTALGEIARPYNGRAIHKPGGVYSIKRDLEGQAPIAMYTMRNIIKGSFGVEHNLPVDEKVNFVRVTYQNAIEGYRETTVDCVPSGITQDEPYEVRLRGVTDEQTAYSIGMRMANESLYRRKRISFETGLEGFIVNYMDTIRVAHYQLGLEETIASISGEVKFNNLNVLTVFEDLSDLIGEPDLRCYLMDIDGSPWGPVACSVISDTEIDLGSNTPPPGVIFYGDNHQGPKFAIGKTDDFMVEAKVTKVIQTGEHTVRVECVEDTPQAYGAPGSPGYSPIDPPEDATPRVTELQAYYYGSDDALGIRLTWRGQYADYYLVELSEDSGVTYELADRTTDDSTSFPIPQVDPLYIRVRGVRLFVGPPAIVILNPFSREVSYPGVYDLHPMYPFNGDKVGVQWTPLTTGQQARVKFIFNGTVIKQVDVTETTYFAEVTREEVMEVQGQSIYGTMFPAPGTRTCTVRMHGLNTVNGVLTESPTYTELVMTNDAMTALLNIEIRVVGSQVGISFVWPEPSPGGVFVHLSTTGAFTPNDSTLVHFGNSNNISITAALVAPETYYLKIGGCDLWGPDNLDWGTERVINTVEDSDFVMPPIDDSMLHPDLSDRIDYIDITDGGLVLKMGNAETTLGNHATTLGDHATTLGDHATSIDANSASIVTHGTRITDNEGNISANNTLIAGVRTDLTTAEGGITANASSITAHDTRITTNEGDITTNASLISGVQTDLTTAEGDILANASSITAHNTRITTNEGNISTNASLISGVRTDLTTAEGDITANASSITAHNTRITTNEGDITSQASLISGVRTDLTTAEGDITANASSISSHDARITTAEGNISSNASAITGVESDISGLEGDVSANALSITQHNTRITTNEGDISTNATAITGVDTRLTTAEGTITSHGSSLTQHRTDIDQNEDDITVNSSAVSQVQSTINDPDTGLTAAHAGVQTNASAITSFEGDISTIEAKYTVKVDANGYMAGYGIIATDNDGIPTSEFFVSADKFYVASPTATDMSFAIEDGKVKMDGAHIKNATILNAAIGNATIEGAKIKDAAITTAKIGDAQIDTLQVAGAAITASFFAEDLNTYGMPDPISGSPDHLPMMSVYITVDNTTIDSSWLIHWYGNWYRYQSGMHNDTANSTDVTFLLEVRNATDGGPWIEIAREKQSSTLSKMGIYVSGSGSRFDLSILDSWNNVNANYAPGVLSGEKVFEIRAASTNESTVYWLSGEILQQHLIIHSAKR